MSTLGHRKTLSLPRVNSIIQSTSNSILNNPPQLTQLNETIMRKSIKNTEPDYRLKSKSIFEKIPSFPNISKNESLSGFDSDRLKTISITKGELNRIYKNMENEILEEQNKKLTKKEDIIEEILSKMPHYENSKYDFAFKKTDMKNILNQYGQKIKREISQESEENKKIQEEKIAEYYYKQQNFMNLLNYYYYYNPILYKEIIDEYNHRIHNKILNQLGLTDIYSNKKQPPLDSGVKFNVSVENNNTLNSNTLKTNETNSFPKSNIRKSLFIGQNPDVLESQRKSIMGYNSPIMKRKSEYIKKIVNENDRTSESRKTINQIRGSDLSSKKKSIYTPKETNEIQPQIEKDDVLEKMDLSRIKRKSVMPSKEKRELLIKKDNENDILKGSLLSSINSDSSDYNIFGNEKKNSLKPRESNFTKNMYINKEEKEIIAKRYGIEIRRLDYLRLKNDDILNEDLIQFFLNYLQEKQKFLSHSKLKENKLRIYFLPINLYNQIINNNFVQNINLDNIFYSFDKIILPVNDVEFCGFLLINLKERKVIIYDCLKQNFNIQPNKHPISISILQFFVNNSKNKTDGINKFKFEYGNIDKIEEENKRMLYICKSIYLISQNTLNLQNSAKNFYEFKQKLVNLLLKIGTVETQKNEALNLKEFDL